MSERRYQPTSSAQMADFPDPAEFSVVNCPYCIDARHQFVAEEMDEHWETDPLHEWPRGSS